MKSKKTEQRIKNSFVALLNEKRINEITVNDIAEKSRINRNTFYYHFKNVPNLVETMAKETMDEVVAEHPLAHGSVENCLIAIVETIKNNQKIIYQIYDSSNRKFFEWHLWRMLDYLFSALIESSNDKRNFTDEEKEVLKKCLEFEAFGFIIDWINHGMPEDVVDKIKILTSLKWTTERSETGNGFRHSSKNI